MDCCDPESRKPENKGGKMETKKIVLWIVVGVLVITALYVVLNSGNVQNVQAIGQAAPRAGGMVGGC